MTRLPDCLPDCLLLIASEETKRRTSKTITHTRLTWIITTYFRALKYLSRSTPIYFLVFAILHVHPSTRSRHRLQHVELHIFYIRKRERYIRRRAYATFSVDLYAIFFLKPHANLHDGCMANSNLGAFLSRIIGYALFCAPLK